MGSGKISTTNHVNVKCERYASNYLENIQIYKATSSLNITLVDLNLDLNLKVFNVLEWLGLNKIS